VNLIKLDVAIPPTQPNLEEQVRLADSKVEFRRYIASGGTNPFGQRSSLSRSSTPEGFFQAELKIY
jgi:hypothetical protein